MALKRELSKQKGIELCADLLSIGKNRKDILQELTKDYKLSDSTVDKWIKQAKVIVEGRQAELEAIRQSEAAAMTIEALKTGLKSDLELEAFLCQMAIGDVQVEEIIEGGIVLRSVTPAERTKAIDLIWKKRGTYAAEKREITGKDGAPVLQLLPTRLVLAPDLDEEPNLFADGNE